MRRSMRISGERGYVGGLHAADKQVAFLVLRARLRMDHGGPMTEFCSAQLLGIAMVTALPSLKSHIGRCLSRRSRPNAADSQTGSKCLPEIIRDSFSGIRPTTGTHRGKLVPATRLLPGILQQTTPSSILLTPAEMIPDRH